MPPTSLLHKQNSRAAFITYLPHGSAVVSPPCTGGGNSPLLPLYRPGSRDRRASDDLGRERDGTPQSGVHILYQTGEKGQKGPRRCYCCKRRRATPGAPYPGCSLLAVLNRQLSCQKMGSRAAFVAYLPHGSAVVSPLRIGEETNPLLPLYRPGGRDRRASDALGRERDGTPHSYCDWSDCYSD